MFASQTLDIAIGMVFVYLTLSLLCSGINEWIAQVLRSRAKYLEQWIHDLLSGNSQPQDTAQEKRALRPAAPADLSKNEMVQAFWQHPLIKALRQDGKQPSYIPAHTFMLAFLDVLTPIDPAIGSRTLDDIREQIKTLPDPDLQKTLLALLDDAGDNIAEVRHNIEAWFDDAMERLAGWYKRRTRVVILCLALVVSVGLNVDSFRVVSALYRDATVRAAVVAAAQRAAQSESQPSTESPLTQIDQVQTELQRLNIPMGWSNPAMRPDLMDWWQLLMAAAGWAITALAVSQGAPFWFDLLNRLVNLRATGERPSAPEPVERRETQLIIQAPPAQVDAQAGVRPPALHTAAGPGD